MRSNSSTVHTTASAGDGAVEGLLYGLVAGVIMLAYLVFISLALQSGPLNLLATVAGGLDVAPLLVIVGHFALAALYGVVWGMLCYLILARVTLPFWLWGLLYGALLWAVSALLLPAGLDVPVIYGGGAHLLFGLSLGLLTGVKATSGKV